MRKVIVVVPLKVYPHVTVQYDVYYGFTLICHNGQ